MICCTSHRLGPRLQRGWARFNCPVANVNADATTMPSAPQKRDPFIAGIVLVLWVLLGIFVLYPLARLFGRAFSTMARSCCSRFWTSSAIPITARHSEQSCCWRWRLAWRYGARLPVRVHRRSRRAQQAGDGIIDTATLLPLISPPFTISVAILFSFGARGLITYDLLGIKGFRRLRLHEHRAAEIITYFPIAYLTLRPILASIDPNIENAAFSMGATLARFRTMTLPLRCPGIANAFLLLFACSLADFATPLILSGNGFPVLPTEAFCRSPASLTCAAGRCCRSCCWCRRRLFSSAALLAGRAALSRSAAKPARRAASKSLTPGMRYMLFRRLWCGGGGGGLFLSGAAVRLAGGGVRRQSLADLQALSRHLHRRHSWRSATR